MAQSKACFMFEYDLNDVWGQGCPQRVIVGRIEYLHYISFFYLILWFCWLWCWMLKWLYNVNDLKLPTSKYAEPALVHSLRVAEFCLPWCAIPYISYPSIPITPFSILSASHLYTRDNPVRKQIKQYMTLKKKMHACHVESLPQIFQHARPGWLALSLWHKPMKTSSPPASTLLPLLAAVCKSRKTDTLSLPGQ